MLGNNGPQGLNLYAGGQGRVMGSDQFHLMNVQSAQNQMQGVQANSAQAMRQAHDQAQKQAASKSLTDILLNLAGQGAGRNVPAYNKHEQAGRDGLQNPALVDQGTPLPIPFDRQWDLASNLQAYIKTLPPETFQMNEEIKQLVDQTLPQAQRSLVHRSSIYEKVPDNPMVNRLNIALQRKREQSIYAVV